MGERFKNICAGVSVRRNPSTTRSPLTNVLEFPLSEFCNRYVNCA